ncbi:hypothetical protein [Arthrobacter sp. zg-Y769]|uniref:hypothetical protein n=1 Tax=Arthrobacter sp. zg-Y769 TaxID=2894191 RepID=UPI001E418C89|nr:hypothetical protein [Arthrobacter sp. zg-Y769]MCC9204136.1 hypothetical protein [Arthrobacter sp. zg-Y769]
MQQHSGQSVPPIPADKQPEETAPVPGPMLPPPPPAPETAAEAAPAMGPQKRGDRRKAAERTRTDKPQTDRQATKRKAARIWLAAAGVVLLAGGAVGGHFLTDPTRSEEYIALSEESAQRQSMLEKSQDDYSTMKEDYDKLSSGMYEREKKVGEREDAVAKSEADVKKRESAVTSAEKQKAANTISDGTWTVGSNVSPGTYTTAADVGSRCYWGIYRSGSNGDDILQNDIPGGGRPTVTLAEGQDFKSSNCGKWVKQ